LRIPFDGETENSILSRVRFCARRNDFDATVVEMGSKKLVDMLIEGAKDMREKNTTLIDR
jgi:hypothetical protein